MRTRRVRRLVLVGGLLIAGAGALIARFYHEAGRVSPVATYELKNVGSSADPWFDLTWDFAPGAILYESHGAIYSVRVQQGTEQLLCRAPSRTISLVRAVGDSALLVVEGIAGDSSFRGTTVKIISRAQGNTLNQRVIPEHAIGGWAPAAPVFAYWEAAHPDRISVLRFTAQGCRQQALLVPSGFQKPTTLEYSETGRTVIAHLTDGDSVVALAVPEGNEPGQYSSQIVAQWHKPRGSADWAEESALSPTDASGQRWVAQTINTSGRFLPAGPAVGGQSFVQTYLVGPPAQLMERARLDPPFHIDWLGEFGISRRLSEPAFSARDGWLAMSETPEACASPTLVLVWRPGERMRMTTKCDDEARFLWSPSGAELLVLCGRSRLQIYRPGDGGR